MKIKYFILFFVLVFFLLILRFYSYYSNLPRLKDGQEIVVNAVITSEPEISGRLQRFRISPRGINVYITTAKYPIYKYGEKLKIEGEVRLSESEGRIYHSMSFPKISQINNSSNLSFSLSLWIRNRAIEIFGIYLDPVHSALLLGIVFGIKQNMPDDFFQILRNAGVVHVIAASGMNVSMVAGTFIFIFQRFFKRRIALFVSLIGITMYIFIAGFEASIIRAGIMAGITFSAGLTGRQKLPVYTLFLTILIMLFINPSWFFDIGFQLSVFATLGILIGKPLLDRKIKIFGRLGILGDDLKTTLAAQIATFPILITYFSSVNLLSVIVNMLVLWTIPILMTIGGISIISGLIFTQLGGYFTVFSIPLLIYFEKVVVWFDRYKIPLQIENPSWILWIGYYLLLGAVVVFEVKREKRIEKAEGRGVRVNVK